MAVCVAEVAMGGRKTEQGMRMGEMLEIIRRERDLTQQQVADRLGMSLQGYLNYRKGYGRVRSDAVEKWARALGVPPQELADRLGISLFTVSDASCLRRELASLLGPDDADQVDALVRDLVTFPDSDRRQVLDTIRDQITGRRARLQRD